MQSAEGWKCIQVNSWFQCSQLEAVYYSELMKSSTLHFFSHCSEKEGGKRRASGAEPGHRDSGARELSFLAPTYFPTLILTPLTYFCGHVQGDRPSCLLPLNHPWNYNEIVVIFLWQCYWCIIHTLHNLFTQRVQFSNLYLQSYVTTITFHHPRKKHCTPQQSPFQIPLPLDATQVLSISVDLPIPANSTSEIMQ